MRRMPLLAVLAFVAASTAPAAEADSTTTQTLPPGGTMRSSQDASPSPANPVIVTVTNREHAPPPGCPCGDGSATFTIAIKNKHDRGRSDGLEGPNGYDFVGPQIDITGGPRVDTWIAVSFEVDSSAYLPNFAKAGPNINDHQFFYENYVPNRRPPSFPTIPVVEKLADGDVRFTTPKDQFGVERESVGSFDLLQQSFYVGSGYDGNDKGSLQTALRKGVLIDFSGNYKNSVEAKITLSPSVARRLHLKSATIGAKNFPETGSGSGRIKLTSAAVKALKKYKKVVVYVETVHTGPEGQIKTKKSKATLTTQRPGGDELG